METSVKSGKEILHERALSLSQPMEKEEGEKLKLLIFSLTGEWYGLKLDAVKEVLTVRRITALPCTPACIKGLMNLRGAVVSVTDPKWLLGLNRSRDCKPEAAIVVEVEDTATVLLVDEVFGVVDTPAEAVEPPLLTLQRAQGEFLIGEVNFEDKLVGILNPGEILSHSVEGMDLHHLKMEIS